MSRLLKFVATAVAALSVVALLPQAAWAVEGMGAHKGSFLYMPYWNNVGPNRTFFRLGMDTEINDVTPLGSIQLHIFYLARNPLATSINQEIPACFEYDRYLTFTPDDWELLNTYSHNKQFEGGDGRLGWAFAYAVLVRPDAPRQKLLWDRFFSDTFIVDTTLGTTVAWSNMAIWGNNWTNPNVFPIPVADQDADGLCDYLRDIQNDEFNVAAGNVIPWGPPIGAIAGPIATPTNDVCLLGADDGQATMSTFGILLDPGDPANAVPPVYGPPGEYVGEDFADTFYASYFTDNKSLSGGTFGPTQFSITPIHVDDTANPITGWANPPFPPGWFAPLPLSATFNIADDTGGLSYQFDMEIFDHNEVSYSAPPRFVICHALRSIHQLSNNITLNLRQGHVTIWDVDNIFGTAASEDAVLIGVDTLNNIGGNATFDAAFASYASHNRTSAPMSLFDFFLGIQSPTMYDSDATGSSGDE